MIAHVAQAGEDRGRVVLHLRSANPSAIALEAAVRIARAFQSEIESLFVQDEQLMDGRVAFDPSPQVGGGQRACLLVRSSDRLLEAVES